MRYKTLLLSAFLLLFFVSCDEEEDLPRVNVAVSVKFNVETSVGEPFPGVTVTMGVNKYNLFTNNDTGTPFTTTTISNADGVVEWGNISYNINSEEAIRLIAVGKITVQGQEYTGTEYIYFQTSDAQDL